MEQLEIPFFNQPFYYKLKENFIKNYKKCYKTLYETFIPYELREKAVESVKETVKERGRKKTLYKLIIDFGLFLKPKELFLLYVGIDDIKNGQFRKEIDGEISEILYSIIFHTKRKYKLEDFIEKNVTKRLKLFQKIYNELPLTKNTKFFWFKELLKQYKEKKEPKALYSLDYAIRKYTLTESFDKDLEIINTINVSFFGERDLFDIYYRNFFK